MACVPEFGKERIPQKERFWFRNQNMIFIIMEQISQSDRLSAEQTLFRKKASINLYCSTPRIFCHQYVNLSCTIIDTAVTAGAHITSIKGRWITENFGSAQAFNFAGLAFWKKRNKHKWKCMQYLLRGWSNEI